MMHPKSLRLLLITVLLCAQIATIAFVVASMQRVTTQKFTSNAFSRVQVMADSFAAQARHYLEPAENSLRVMQELIANGKLAVNDMHALEDHFQLEMLINPSILGIILGRDDGSFVAASHDEAGHKTSYSVFGVSDSLLETREYDAGQNLERRWLDTGSDYDPRQRPWYVEAMRSDNMAWTNPYLFFNTGKSALSVTVRLPKRDGQPQAVLAVHIDISELSAFVSTIPGAQGGSAAVVDKAFNTIAHSDTERPLFEPESGLLPLDKVASEPLRTLKDLNSTPAHTVDGKSSGFTRFMVGDEEHVGMSRPFVLAEGRVNWTLLVQAPAAEYAGGLQDYFVNRLWALVGVVIVTSLLAVFAIVGLTAPVYEMHRNATRDRLTGALSRGEFQRRFSAMNKRRRHHESGLQTVLVALDLDGFKAVNDQHGHAAGDQVLVEIVARLRSRLRRHDLVGRFGGDEFIVAMQLERSMDVGPVVERIRASVTNEPISTDTGHHAIGITAGIALHASDETLESTMERADHALVTGKTITKNRSYLARADIPASETIDNEQTSALIDSSATSTVKDVTPETRQQPRETA